MMQRESGLHNFVVKQNYEAALDCFTEWRFPLENLIVLFSELLPKKYINKHMKQFNLQDA